MLIILLRGNVRSSVNSRPDTLSAAGLKSLRIHQKRLEQLPDRALRDLIEQSQLHIIRLHESAFSTEVHEIKTGKREVSRPSVITIVTQNLPRSCVT